VEGGATSLVEFEYEIREAQRDLAAVPFNWLWIATSGVAAFLVGVLALLVLTPRTVTYRHGVGVELAEVTSGGQKVDDPRRLPPGEYEARYRWIDGGGPVDEPLAAVPVTIPWYGFSAVEVSPPEQASHTQAVDRLIREKGLLEER
jgi:hypothetical protein